MKEQEIAIQEEIEREAIEKAKNRIDILGFHRSPSTKFRGFTKPSKIKTSRMKTFYMKKNLQSWSDFLEKKISLKELRELQKAGK